MTAGKLDLSKLPVPFDHELTLASVFYHANGWPMTFAVAREYARRELGVWIEIQAERDRAHEKWKDSNNGSMERMPIDSDRRMTIIAEELGEAAAELNDYWLAIAALERAIRRKESRLALREEAADCLQRLREELIQVAAMAGAWAEKLGGVDR